ncbi:hypothetical protein [Candidatus Chloroploca sp. Khr17]|uniref:hypothetical protein n=1 Tax=Candidatus Chloroploca sp. Khr17 TaxID=2496869 RepID=UPI00101CEA47|nr:hypothetical protein [Candidatus Chloroploca sp. Khr17]
MLRLSRPVYVEPEVGSATTARTRLRGILQAERGLCAGISSSPTATATATARPPARAMSSDEMLRRLLDEQIPGGREP